MNKMYFQLFSEEVRPQSLISRHRDDIKSFISDVGGNAVIDAMRRKVAYMSYYHRDFANVEMAML